MSEVEDPLAGEPTPLTDAQLRTEADHLKGELVRLHKVCDGLRDKYGSMENHRVHAQEAYDSAIIMTKFLEKQLSGLIHNLGINRDNCKNLIDELEADRNRT